MQIYDLKNFTCTVTTDICLILRFKSHAHGKPFSTYVWSVNLRLYLALLLQSMLLIVTLMLL